MKYLVTGGAGFIGSHLCEKLVKEGHEVWCLDNFVTGSPDNITHLQNGDYAFHLIEHDISQPYDCKEKVDFVLHMASPASPIDYLRLPIQTMKVGALGTYNCMGIAKRYQATFFLASTSEVYGDPLIHPQEESYYGNVNPIGPRSVYDEAKRYAEALTMAYHRVHGIPIRMARIFNTYGPRMQVEDGRVVPTFIAQALKGEPLTVFGDGMQTRSFCYVSDMVEGIYKLVHSNVETPVNLGNPAEMTILDFAKKISALLGRSVDDIQYKPLPQDDPKVRRPNINKAKKALNWEPVVLLDDGLKPTIEYFEQKVRYRKK